MPAAPEHANPPSPGTLRIRSIETVPVLAPLARTFRGSFYKMTHRATLVTRVITEEGIVGEAYAGDEDKKREVPVVPLQDWQIFYFRGGAWSNPLSSDGSDKETQSALPDGVRAVLTLPPGQAITGRLTLDWARPTVGGGKS